MARSIVRNWVGSLSLIAFGLFVTSASAFAQEKRPIVYVAPIEGIIDLGLAPFVQRVLDEAQEAGAAAVILEINTFGGRVDAAVLIRDVLLNAPVRTVAFVSKRAIAAGAQEQHDDAANDEALEKLYDEVKEARLASAPCIANVDHLGRGSARKGCGAKREIRADTY